ncbi:hypothetical protein [Beggiatoa leptomitoformis]|uniref:Uncharacterized protein n=1 Tax=Beggiatoa leptomitoformis TaxID=288004 RepID=A0A2N9YI54_9GAMM|nr:hypothetical protein [Beggiatoa leptomitoformis]ALG67675.1 hypothetical protein AL038_08090 [Beggiatoa leptomitoformis]AUI70089.1 hypothetical protein BLE401_16215 [Beggiatoa leptomitoformis]
MRYYSILSKVSILVLSLGYISFHISTIEAKPYSEIAQQHAQECRSNAYEVQKNLLLLDRITLPEAELQATITARTAITEDQLGTSLCYYEVQGRSGKQYNVCMLHDGANWINCSLYEDLALNDAHLSL